MSEAAMGDEHEEPSPDRVRKVSVSMPESLAREIRERVGPGAFSRYVTEAAHHKLKQDQLTELLADMEAANGPVSDDELAAVEAVWLEAEESWRDRGSS
jgi:Arc/MetJ-type ribon-helix-helix transcriptional regulator